MSKFNCVYLIMIMMGVCLFWLNLARIPPCKWEVIFQFLPGTSTQHPMCNSIQICHQVIFFSIFVKIKSSTLFLPKYNNYNIKLLINIRRDTKKLRNECFFLLKPIFSVCFFSSCERYTVHVLVLHTRIFLRSVQLSILFCLNFFALTKF